MVRFVRIFRHARTGLQRMRGIKRDMYMLMGLMRACSPWKRLLIFFTIFILVMSTVGLIRSYQAESTMTGLQNLKTSKVQNIGVKRPNNRHRHNVPNITVLVSDIKSKLQIIQTMYSSRQDSLFKIKQNIINENLKTSEELAANQKEVFGVAPNTPPPETASIMKEISGMAVTSGLKNIKEIQLPYLYHSLPHLLKNPYSMVPSYHFKSNREFSEIVIGIPTVKRDKESYLMVTLTHVISGLAEEDVNNTLIVVFIGETNMTYVLNTSQQIERRFPNEIEIGMIEIIAPDASYYPDLDSLTPTLNDPMKRMKWRTKQNLDIIYLTSYSYTRGSFYLMLEDDIIPKPGYLVAIKSYIADMAEFTPNWIILEFSPIGGFGKLFRSTDLAHFVSYVQMFFKNNPIDWLLESYLSSVSSRVCSNSPSINHCQKQKYPGSLFQHIGLYSSLEGKLQHIKDPKFGDLPILQPKKNPKLRNIRSNLSSYYEHTLMKAYQGEIYFWGIKPKKGDYIEFWFTEPLHLKSYLFRSGSLENITDKIYYTVVDALPYENNSSFVKIGEFNKHGLAKGNIDKSLGSISAIRLRTLINSFHWVVISEIHLKTYPKKLFAHISMIKVSKQ